MCPAVDGIGDRPQYRVKSVELPEFAGAVLDLVDQIPAGKVLAYGDVAELLGQGGPRQVGAVMSRFGSSVPWWRVTRASGEAPAHLQDEAHARWRAEGTALVGGVLAGRRVDLARARWDAGADRLGGGQAGTERRGEAGGGTLPAKEHDAT